MHCYIFKLIFKKLISSSLYWTKSKILKKDVRFTFEIFASDFHKLHISRDFEIIHFLAYFFSFNYYKIIHTRKSPCFGYFRIHGPASTLTLSHKKSIIRSTFQVQFSSWDGVAVQSPPFGGSVE